MTAAARPAPFAERELTITRVLDAPRERVFKAWTDPKELAQWWGPKGFTNPVCEVDLKPGGALRIVMRAPDGGEYPMQGVFREIVPPSRLVFTNIAVDKDGKPIIEGLTTHLRRGRRPDETDVANSQRRRGRLRGRLPEWNGGRLDAELGEAGS